MLASLIDGFLYAEFVPNEWLDLLTVICGEVPMALFSWLSFPAVAAMYAARFACRRCFDITRISRRENVTYFTIKPVI